MDLVEPLAVPASVIAELRRPLASLLAAAELLAAEPMAARSANAVAAVLTHGQQLSRVLADLAELDQLARGSFDQTRSTFAPRTLLQHCLAQVQAAAATRDLELRLDLSPAIPAWIEADAGHLERLLCRLCLAVIERTRLGPIDLTALVHGDRLQVLLQSRSSTAEPGDLLQDLALRYCDAMARALGGDLLVGLHQDGALSLQLRLPFAKPSDLDQQLAAECDGLAPPAPAPRCLRGQVLLIDGTRDPQHMIGQLLLRLGLEVTTAENQLLAAHLLQQQRFDLLLIDLPAADSGELTLLRQLRQDNASLPVVALAADASSQSQADLLAAGCNGQLTKPVDQEQLLQTLALYLPKC